MNDYYSKIHEKELKPEEVKAWCYGCETPLTEDDLQDDNTESTVEGHYYCHIDCYRDSH